MTQKTTRPASGELAGPREADRLGSRINPPNNVSPHKLQAPPLPDVHGENDLLFFLRRPGLTRRLRFPLADEFPLLDDDDVDGIPLVSVRMDRDARGQPIKRVRAIFYRMGGHA